MGLSQGLVKRFKRFMRKFKHVQAFSLKIGDHLYRVGGSFHITNLYYEYGFLIIEGVEKRVRLKPYALVARIEDK